MRPTEVGVHPVPALGGTPATYGRVTLTDVQAWRSRLLGVAAGLVVASAVAIGSGPRGGVAGRWYRDEQYCVGTPRNASSPQEAVRAWAKHCDHHPRITFGPYPAGYPGNSYDGRAYADLAEVAVAGDGPIFYLLVAREHAGGPWQVLDQGGTGP
jgi:hypothetical protein